MKKKFFFGLLFFIPCILFSQSFTNDWIDYNKQYYKIKVYEDGIYRVDYTTLLNAGIPVGSIHPQQFQVYSRGKEQYIYVDGTGISDTIFNPGEFIEFYGEKNTGWLDTSWYSTSAEHANPNISLYTDTSIYFLTWETSGTARRLTLENDLVFSGYTPANYFLFESRKDLYSNFYGGVYQSSGGFDLYDSEFTESEGWAGPSFTSAYSISTPTPNIYSSGSSAIAECVLIGTNLQTHTVSVKIGLGGNNNLTYPAIKVNKLSYNVALTDLGNLNTTFTFTPSGQSPDRNAVGFISIKYPHTFDFGGSSSSKMNILDNIVQSKSYLEIVNFITTSTCWIYDLNNNKRIKTAINGSTLKALVPNSGGEKECYLFSESSINTINNLEDVGILGNAKFTDYTIKDPDSAFIIISNSKLYNDSFGNNHVQEYLLHRSSFIGGGHNVVLADIDELYDQFAYGIRKNPMAIRGFCDYALQNWTTPPQHLLLIGKSVANAYSRNSASNYGKLLLPTFGHPPSDILLTASLIDSTLEPAIATGRIATPTGEKVGEYLNKIKEFDINQLMNIPSQIKSEEEWKKQIIHLAGGVGSQNTLFKQWLNGYEQIVEDTSFGGRVHLFSKNSSDPIQITVSDSIKNLINNGISMITFFGHASGSGFDQNIDDPDSYTNTDGKYPLLIANACLVGDIHQPFYSSNSESWVLHERGVIGFLASVAYGLTTPLNVYSLKLHEKIGQTMYGETIGKCIKSTIRDIQNQSVNKSTYLQMTLHGDPAVVLNSRPKPDYTITISDVYTYPPDISADLDSFDLNMIVTNIGKAINQELSLKVTRRYPPEANIPDTTIYYLNFPATHYKDTIKLKLPVDIINGVGFNQFDIRIDDSQLITELSEVNNDIIYTIWIKTDDISPVYPYEYAVIPNPITSLKATTGDPFAKIETYAFEIDTNDFFNPPLHSIKITHDGGVVEWNPANDPALNSLLNGSTDSTVYFWRVRKDSNDINDTNHIWRESSFQYISGKQGWGQAHFHQFKNNQFNLLDYDKPNRRFEYIKTPKELKCTTIGSAWGNTDWLSTGYKINGSPQISSSCNTPAAILIAVIDPVTLLPWSTTNNPAPCTGSPRNGFVYHISDSTQRLNMSNFLLSVPDSHYILAYTFRYGLTDLWEPAIINTFLSIGWTEILNVGNNIPFAFFIKKGAQSTVIQNVGNSSTATVNLSAQLKTNWDFGYMTSTAVGPTATWKSLHWKYKSLEPNDSVRLKVFGIDNNGTETVIPSLQSLPPDSANIFNLNSRIDASNYPYLKLRASIGDDSLKTAAQLSSWHILLDEVPESAINPSKFLSFYNDTLQEGENMNLSTVIENISEFDMDSLLVSFWVVDRARNIHTLPDIRYKPLLQTPDTILTNVSFSTEGLSGLNSLWIEVNPINPNTGTFNQLEKYHFNNLAEKDFYVIGDITNPMVDVTFDGVHILDGDIVSTEPQIIIELKDENKYLALDTNSLLEVYIKQPGENLYTLIPYDNNILTFLPANLPNNKARVTYNPIFTKDGIYELMVQATDISRNESGDNKYLISFEIISKPSITSVMNWPNPFSTSTKFVFTLTGTDVPQDFRIRIMTISGRIVREIFASELGPLHIGRNISQFSWDGTDEFGDQLANGIYLYKVDIRLDGNAMEIRETNADQYFHKGYGKMYLMR